MWHRHSCLCFWVFFGGWVPHPSPLRVRACSRLLFSVNSVFFLNGLCVKSSFFAFLFVTRSSLAPPETDTASRLPSPGTPDTTHQCCAPCPSGIQTAHAGPSSPAAAASLPAAYSRASARTPGKIVGRR